MLSTQNKLFGNESKANDHTQQLIKDRPCWIVFIYVVIDHLEFQAKISINRLCTNTSANAMDGLF